MKIGIVGCGIICGVMKKWIENYSPEHKLLISDPPKNYNDDLSKADIVFVSIHIPTEPDCTQNLELLENIILNLPNVPIFVRTTLLPGTCDLLSKKLKKRVYFMPEFLTERTAYDDFCIQPMIFTGEIELLKKIFKDKKYIVMTNKEAEITKYAHNVFGALKVTYFNGIFELCAKNNCNYEHIRNGALISGYINEPHTFVPGPDGKFGYGGKCFPKDVDAFAGFAKDTMLEKLICDVHNINEKYRKGIISCH